MLIRIDKMKTDSLTEKADASPRKRMNFNYHTHPGDLLQRMLHASNRGTYVQPHKHEDPDKREVFIILRGKAAVIEYNDEGIITDVVYLDHDAGIFGAEIPSRTWHSIVNLEDKTVLYEVKDGPYSTSDDKFFAPWAPKEGDPGCAAYLDKILSQISGW